jgi:hypothetical protein
MGKLPVEPRLVSFSMREGCGVLARYSVARVTEAEPILAGQNSGQSNLDCPVRTRR